MPKLTIRAFGHGEFLVRLPSLIAGTLIVPVLYAFGRELYDRGREIADEAADMFDRGRKLMEG